MATQIKIGDAVVYVAHNYRGKHDKVYYGVAMVDPSSDHQYIVKGFWGKRVGKLSSQIKSHHSCADSASRSAHALVKKRLCYRGKDRYEDVFSSEYRGELTYREIVDHLVKETGISVSGTMVGVDMAETGKDTTKVVVMKTNDADENQVTNDKGIETLKEGQEVEVIILDNTSIDKFYNEGVSYLATVQESGKWYKVLDNFGNYKVLGAHRLRVTI